MTLQQLRYAVCIAKNKSMNKAAAELFISQPSLSVTIRDLEEEIGFPLFQRSSRGIVITAEGEDFYARQMIEQYRLMEEKFIEKKMQKQKFSVSMQHYTFAVQAFIKVAKELEMDDYEFSVHETKTYDVIDDVKNFRSEIGILYVNDFNQKVLYKLFRDCGLEFHELLRCGIGDRSQRSFAKEAGITPEHVNRNTRACPSIRALTAPFILRKRF